MSLDIVVGILLMVPPLLGFGLAWVLHMSDSRDAVFLEIAQDACAHGAFYGPIWVGLVFGLFLGEGEKHHWAWLIGLLGTILGFGLLRIAWRFGRRRHLLLEE